MSGLLLDTDILSMFAKVDALDLLVQLLGCDQLPVTLGVFNEIAAPLEFGYDYPAKVFAVVEVILMKPEEFNLCECLRLEGRVSLTDAEMIAICQSRGWRFVTMDRVATRRAAERNVVTMDLQALLKGIWAKGLLSKGELRGLAERMEKADRTTFRFKDALFESME